MSGIWPKAILGMPSIPCGPSGKCCEGTNKYNFSYYNWFAMCVTNEFCDFGKCL